MATVTQERRLNMQNASPEPQPAVAVASGLLNIPALSPREEIAVLLRALAAQGYVHHLFGHISVAQPDGTFLVSPLELRWDGVCASDLIVMDQQGQKIEGKYSISEGIGLHVALRRHLPPELTRVVIHHHPKYATLWAALRRIPPIYDQGGAFFLKDPYLVQEYGDSDVVLVDRHAKAIGEAGWALLSRHGAVVLGCDIAT